MGRVDGAGDPNRPTDVDALIVSAIGAVAPDASVRVESLDPTVDLWAALDLDSMDHVVIVERLSAGIGRDIPEADAPLLLTLESMRRYLVS
jgi:acyl carrier protein